jgi:hypothetical protein
MTTLRNFFRGDSLGRIIKNFPYPERFCPFCDQPLKMVDAVHVQDQPETYKALYICLNDKCGAYDEPARKAYAMVYYSS